MPPKASQGLLWLPKAVQALSLDFLWIAYGCPMDVLWISVWISYGFPMDFLWLSYGFPMAFLWLSYGFPMDFL